MSFVGKILVVIQFVLSICFVAFAGVVYTAHMNWRDEAKKQQAAATKLQKDLSDKQSEMDNAKRDLNAKIVAADGKNGIQGDPRGSTAEIGRALIDKNMARTVDLIRQSIAAR